MKLIASKSLSKANNTVILAASINELGKSLSKDLTAFFKKKWQEESLQYIKTATGFSFAINTSNLSIDKIRREAFEIHKMVKNETALSVLGESEDKLMAFSEGFMLSNYQFLHYFKEAKKKQNKIKKLEVVGVSQKQLDELSNLIESVFWARDMVNEPVSFLDAPQLAKEIKAKGKANNYKVEILGKAKIQALKMGGLLAVNQGSETPPTFTIVEYKPKNAKNKKPYVLVGKGVVYDTGGLSLKPTPHSMDLMKSDMGGAACMAGTIDALAKNKIPVHVIGLIPATDNRPGKTAYAPGDVVTM
jgi:leucyl aminopeptidase